MENESKVQEPRHPVRLVSERTGLSPHVLRVWERRYGAVHPTRTEGKQRLYSDADIARLQLLHRAARAGRNIGQLVGLSNQALVELIASDADHQSSAPAPAPAFPTPSGEAAAVLQTCIEAVRRLDPAMLEGALRRAMLLLTLPVVTDAILVPLLREIGIRWSEGQLGIAHEHVASAVVRRILDEATRTFEPAPGAPAIVVGTPAGQQHELGAMLAAASAASVGCRVTYLGTDLPALEIARAAKLAGAGIVALSIVHPVNDARLIRELQDLVSSLPSDRSLILGGSAAEHYAETLVGAGVRVVGSLAELRQTLVGLRNAAGS